MALDINQLRQAFAKRSEGTGENSNAGFWEKFYPFFRMNFDETAVFRFLADADQDNPLGFIVENKYHELVINGQKKKIACGKMYGDSCACCERSTYYYNEMKDEKLGKMFWRKIDYLAQGVVLSSPFEFIVKDDENPVRLVSLGVKIFKKIETEITKGDMDSMPYHLDQGYNFNIMKSRQGEYADYTNSTFARKATPVPDNIRVRIEPYNLKDYRFMQIERVQMEAMIEAALTGRSLPTENKTDAPKQTKSPDEVVNEVKQPEAAATATPATGVKRSPQEILKELKERAAATAGK